jgi:branched-chain amino acid transport system substrate-binding protein
LEAVRKAAARGEVTHRLIREALETSDGIDTGGLTTPLSFTASDHRPSMGSHIYTINQFGKFAYQTAITLERKADWLGW